MISLELAKEVLVKDLRLQNYHVNTQCSLSLHTLQILSHDNMILIKLAK